METAHFSFRSFGKSIIFIVVSSLVDYSGMIESLLDCEVQIKLCHHFATENDICYPMADSQSPLAYPDANVAYFFC